MEKDEEFTPVASKLKPKVVGKLKIMDTVSIHGPSVNDTQEILSDHAFQIIEIAPDIEMLIWNIMTRGQVTKDRTNNAYRLNENDAAYAKRLRIPIPAKLDEVLKNNPKVKVISLEEAPGPGPVKTGFIRTLKDFLPTWQINDNLSQKTGNFELLTLVDRSALQKDPKRIAINNLTEQKDRVLAADFVFGKEDEGEPGKKIRIINCHFKAVKDRGEGEPKKFYGPGDSLTEINTLLNSTTDQVVVAGDFNQNLGEVKKLKKDNDPGFYCQSDEPTSYSSSAEPQIKKVKKIKNGKEVEVDEKVYTLNKKNVDGFIFRYDPEKYVYQHNPAQPQVVSYFYQKISSQKIINHFSKNYDVASDSRANTITIKPFKLNPAESPSVVLQKTGLDMLEMKASNSAPATLGILTEALKLCLPAKSAVDIDATPGKGTPEERQEALENLWLKLVKDGFKVNNFKPSDEFLDYHKDELPAEYDTGSNPSP